MNGIYPRVFALVISTEKGFLKMLYAFDLGLDILTCMFLSLSLLRSYWDRFLTFYHRMTNALSLSVPNTLLTYLTSVPVGKIAEYGMHFLYL